MRSPGRIVDRRRCARRVAVPRRDQQRALVIGVDQPDRVAEHQALRDGRGPERGSTSAHHSGSPMRKAIPAEISTAGACGASAAARRGRRADRAPPPARAVTRKAPAGEAAADRRILARPSTALMRQPGRARGDPLARAGAATSRLVIAGQSSTPPASTRWIVLRSPPKVPVAGDTSLARIQSQPLRCRFASALATTFVGLGGKADDQRRPVVAALRERREDVGVFDEAQRRRAPCRPF